MFRTSAENSLMTGTTGSKTAVMSSSENKGANFARGNSPVKDDGVTAGSGDSNNSGIEPCQAGGRAEVILTGKAFISGKEGSLELTSKGLVVKDRKAKDKLFQDNFLAWCDVIHATVDPKHTDKQQHQTFILHYVQHLAKFRLRWSSVKLEIQDGHAEKWITTIHEQCHKVEGRPKKLFVVINPIGGSGSAQQIYQRRVAPIFENAEIHTSVVVTERAKHALELGETQDFSDYDGIVIVGGDGLYNETLQGVYVQTQKKAGTDYHNPAASVAKPDIPFAIIPAGTGNGATGWYNSTVDVETAALNVIRGEIHRAQLFILHSGEKFLRVSTLVFAYGALSDVIKRTDELRWMKRARYPYALGAMIFKKKRLFECDLKYRTLKDPNSQDMATSGDGPVASADNEGWQAHNNGSGHYGGMFAFTCDYLALSADKSIPYPFGDSTQLMVDTGCSGIGLLKGMMSAITGKNPSWMPQHLEFISKVTDLKLRILRDETFGSEEPSGAGARLRELERILNIDGEVVYFNDPEITVRLHPHFVPVFGQLQHPVKREGMIDVSG